MLVTSMVLSLPRVSLLLEAMQEACNCMESSILVPSPARQTFKFHQHKLLQDKALVPILLQLQWLFPPLLPPSSQWLLPPLPPPSSQWLHHNQLQEGGVALRTGSSASTIQAGVETRNQIVIDVDRHGSQAALRAAPALLVGATAPPMLVDAAHLVAV
jgi:hypothetical protein